MKKKCYVYYDKKSGRITEILKKRNPGRAVYIECDISDVIGFLDNSWNLNEYVVAYKKDEDKTVIMKKENIVRLRQESAKLYKIPNRKKETELILTYYPDNILEVRFDMSLISPLYTTDFKEEIEFEKGTEIRLFINDKKSGEVYKEILFEAQELLEKGFMFFRLPDECYSKNISFYTYKLLNSYSWSVGKYKIKSPMKDNIKYDIHKADIKRKDNFDYSLIFTPIKNSLSVKNNIEDLELSRVHNHLEFFITDYYDPHVLHGKFNITEEMLQDKEFQILFDDKIDNFENKAILYNHKYISVLLEM